MNLNLLKEPYQLNKAQVEFYEKNAYIKLKEVLTPDIIKHFNTVISEKVAELNNVEVPIDKRDTYGKAFLQLFNLWEKDETIKQLVFSKRLAKLATDLMQINGVRIYHDQALFKEAGGGITPWHADQYYWPLSSDKAITAWIPLQETPLEMGPLEFSEGSQEIITGRELSISDESEEKIRKNLKINNFNHVIEPFDIGEVSFHSGWIFHRAGANTTKKNRNVMTIIYMDKDMKLKKPENDGQLNDWETWCPGAKIGEVIDSRLNPILHEI
ncbi:MULTISPECIES: phytanoyl-CoA dioxygenase family protein [unclassified Croceitalea]|uniref:phytanoyl-CoA dioxygenase family protein n=1 Tax=unclassified Croceitalea TaxID=2632280 RepID=UPI0030DD7F91